MGSVGFMLEQIYKKIKMALIKAGRKSVMRK